MKKNGFTLIELLLVIVIVAAIGASSSIVFTQVNDNTAEEELKNMYISFQRGAKIYVDLNDNWSKSFNERGFVTVSLSALQSTNFIANNLKDPVSNYPIPLSYIVKLCVANDDPEGKDIGKYVESCIISNDNECVSNEFGTNVDCCTHCK